MIRKLYTAELFLFSAFALHALLMPRCMYLAGHEMFRPYVAVYPGMTPGRIDAIGGYLTLSLLPVLGYVCYRAAGVVAATRKTLRPSLPGVLMIGIGWISVMPVVLVPLTDSFGKWIPIAGALCWMVSGLSVLGYVGALCAVDIERRSEPAGALLLSATYNLGGAGGVYLVGRLAPESRTIAAVTRNPPTVAIFTAAILVVYLLIRMT